MGADDDIGAEADAAAPDAAPIGAPTWDAAKLAVAKPRHSAAVDKARRVFFMDQLQVVCSREVGL